MIHVRTNAIERRVYANESLQQYAQTIPSAFEMRVCVVDVS